MKVTAAFLTAAGLTLGLTGAVKANDYHLDPDVINPEHINDEGVSKYYICTEFGSANAMVVVPGEDWQNTEPLGILPIDTLVTNITPYSDESTIKFGDMGCSLDVDGDGYEDVFFPYQNNPIEFEVQFPTTTL